MIDTKGRLTVEGDQVIYKKYLDVTHCIENDLSDYKDIYIYNDHRKKHYWATMKNYIKQHERMRKPGSYIKLFAGWSSAVQDNKLSKIQAKAIIKEVKNMKAVDINDDFTMYEPKQC